MAHDIGHFVLPGQHEVSAPCKQQRIENWDADLYRPELEANRFAAEILMPRRLMAEFAQSEPSLESIRSIAQLCGTSLTASAVRLITLTPLKRLSDLQIFWLGLFGVSPLRRN
jgi:Zn-dependent peptidase ImmA (M78 family)